MASSTNGHASNETGSWYVYKNQLHLNSDWDSALDIISYSDNTLVFQCDGVTYTFTSDPNITPHDADWHYLIIKAELRKNGQRASLAEKTRSDT